jgi:hypothetical protein
LLFGPLDIDPGKSVSGDLAFPLFRTEEGILMGDFESVVEHVPPGLPVAFLALRDLDSGEEVAHEVTHSAKSQKAVSLNQVVERRRAVKKSVEQTRGDLSAHLDAINTLMEEKGFGLNPNVPGTKGQTDRELSEWILLGEQVKESLAGLSNSDMEVTQRTNVAMNAEAWALSVRHWMDNTELQPFIGLFPPGERVQMPGTVEAIGSFIDSRVTALKGILERRQLG